MEPISHSTLENTHESCATRETFQPTRWTLVLRAQGQSQEARDAFSSLCEHYWQPVFKFLQRSGRDEDVARELTQEFWSRLLAGGHLAADPQQGRFRSFLLGALKHFLADRREYLHRQKRGGGVTHESLDHAAGNTSAASLQVSDPSAMPSDEVFDREWAFTIIAQALAGVETEMKVEGKLEQFRALKPWLVGDAAGSQAEAAAKLRMSETALKVAIHRLRKRFRQQVRAAIAETTNDPAAAQEELRYLVDVISKG